MLVYLLWHNALHAKFHKGLVFPANTRYNGVQQTKNARQEQGVGRTLSPDREADTFRANGFLSRTLANILYPLTCRLASCRGRFCIANGARYGFFIPSHRFLFVVSGVCGMCPALLRQKLRRGAETMFCGKCGNQLFEGAGFCPKCGFANNPAPEPVAKNHQNQQGGYPRSVRLWPFMVSGIPLIIFGMMMRVAGDEMNREWWIHGPRAGDSVISLGTFLLVVGVALIAYGLWKKNKR